MAGLKKGGEAMSEILLLGVVAIVFVIAMAWVLGRLVEREDLSSYVEG